jgi:hypothetical protein
VQVLGTNTNFEMAMARQSCATADAECPFRNLFKRMLHGAMDDTRTQTAGTGRPNQDPSAAAGGASNNTASRLDVTKIEAKLNEALALTFFAPMLANALNESRQTYFVNSPTEQAYARQLYMQIATKIGQSSKLPLARNIARALQQRLAGTARAATS